MKTKAKETPRPLCLCGEPAFFKVEINVQELELTTHHDHFRGGPRQMWSPSFREATKIETVMCQSCQKGSVSLTMTASATIKEGKEVT